MFGCYSAVSSAVSAAIVSGSLGRIHALANKVTRFTKYLNHSPFWLQQAAHSNYIFA